MHSSHHFGGTVNRSPPASQACAEAIARLSLTDVVEINDEVAKAVFYLA